MASWKNMKYKKLLIFLGLFLAATLISYFCLNFYYKKINSSTNPVARFFEKSPEKIFPWWPLLGWDKPLTYLVLFQNNAELRPTGGFWGSYGEVTVSKGHITNYNIDDIYNLDKKVFNNPSVMPDPPWPLAQYLGVEKWYLRDANWSPDFPTSAKQALDFYAREGGASQFDGVIAITPDVFVELLRLVGPITIGDETFTKDNAVERLQYYVQIGYKQDDVSSDKRKQILQSLAQVITRRLVDKLPMAWFNMETSIEKALSRRDVQIYLVDTGLQALSEKNGWSGAIRQTTGDYLMVVDANLNALKTDPKVKREIVYDVGGGELVEARLGLKYNNTATEADWRTADYKTYTRVYVPLGSKLISSNDGSVTTATELGKTVFGFYLTVPLGTTKDLQFEYRLPDSLPTKYKLLVQRQAGTADYPFTIKMFGSEFKGILDQDKSFNLP